MNKETQPSREAVTGGGSIFCVFENEKEKEHFVCFLAVLSFDGALQ